MLTNRIIIISQLIILGIIPGLMPLPVHADTHSDTGIRILKSASEMDYPPFALVRPDGSADGFSVDLLKAIVHTMGMQIDIAVGPWHQIKQNLTNGQLDVLPLVSYSPQRDKIFDFTVPYLRMHGTIFVRKGQTSIRSEDDLKGKQVIVMRGDTAHEYLVHKALATDLILTDSFADAMKLLAAGKHDAVVVQQLVGLQLIKSLALSNVVDIRPYQGIHLKPIERPLSGFEQKFCIAVKDGDQELLATLNEGLAIVMANGTYEKLYNKWFSPILPTPTAPWTAILKITLVVIGPLLLLFSSMVLWYLKKEVNNKTLILKKEINERKRAAKRLQKSQTQLQSIFRVAPTGIGFVIDRIIKDANSRMCEMVGYTKEELIDNNARMLYCCDADYEYVGKEKYNQIKQRGTGTVETRWLRKDGRIIHVLLSSTPIDTDDLSQGVTFTALDITDRKRSEEMLRLTQFSIDHASDAAFWMGPDARIIYVNDAACRNLGYTREDFLTMTMHDIDPLYPAETWVAHWVELRQERTLLFETIHKCKDGRTINVEVCANYLEYAGVEYNHAFARDITARKQAEKEQLQLEKQMQHAQKLESLGVLAGGIAHDFNNILMTIIGNADIALQDMSPYSPVRDNVCEIEKAARQAVGLSKQMLAYSGKGKFIVEPIAINELVSEMGNMLEVSISKKAILKYNFADNLPPFDGDITQIRQIIMNLIMNASEAIGDKSGVIAISTGAMDCDRAYLNSATIASRAGLDAQLPESVYVYFEVADTGCGMDKKTQEKMFDPFYTTKFTGRGLGMAAVLGIVRGHKGAIKIYSEVSKGTTIKILFPAVADTTAIAHHQESEPADASIWSGTGTVLIADDEESVCAVGKLMLERIGFNVLTAADGREAVDIFRDHAEEIVCVLLDLTMPRLSGDQVYSELRRIDPDVKVVLSSGYNENDATQRFAGKGLAGFIQKPYNSELLAAKLHEVINP